MPHLLSFDAYLILIPILITLTEAGSLCKRASFQQPDYHPADNRALRGKIIEVKTTPSHVLCARDCLIHSSCVSFNYHASNGRCELNNATRVQHPEELVVEPGCVYFDASANTPQFSQRLFNSCKQLLQAGYDQSGVYTIYPAGLRDGIQVYCDQASDGGGWIVFQRRKDGSVDFFRDWKNYTNGFGDLDGELWLGNEKLRRLTESAVKWQLQIDLEDFDGNKVTAGHISFVIAGDRYILNVGPYHGNASNALTHHNGLPFSTKDHDNDNNPGENCALTFEGAWWFNQCHWSHLNGKYYSTGNVPHAHGIQWGGPGLWVYGYVSLKRTSMKIRETD